jgi:uncharacterized protein (UPF0212 family)
MREFIEEEADRLGVSVSELLRRLFLAYRESQAGNASCEHCGERQEIDLRYI